MVPSFGSSGLPKLFQEGIVFVVDCVAVEVDAVFAVVVITGFL